MSDLFQNQTINILNQKQNCNQTLTSATKMLNYLTKNVQIKIGKADKGNSTVIYDKTDYDQRMLSLLQTVTLFRPSGFFSEFIV